MRIIAGQYRGLRLATLKSGKLRPTSDQLRETLFDVLGPAVAGSIFLDAYAGSGAAGLEALSRGAAEVVFLEHHKRAVEVIRKNLASLKIQSGFRIITSQVLAGLETLQAEAARFDFAFLDPPYSEIAEYHHALRQLVRSGMLRDTSRVIAEHSRFCILEEHYGLLRRTRLLRHGDSQLAFYGMDKQQ
jgi:16S rRNA (guanine(966)-N(2))-methyltransferase RsmD